MTMCDVYYNCGSITRYHCLIRVFTFLGFHDSLCWNSKVFTVFNHLVTLICVMKRSGSILHHQPCQRDRSVGPRGRKLSAWQTAQQPLWQKQQHEPNQPEKPQDRRCTQSFVRTRGGNEKKPDISDTRKSNEAKQKDKELFSCLLLAST